MGGIDSAGLGLNFLNVPVLKNDALPPREAQRGVIECSDGGSAAHAGGIEFGVECAVQLAPQHLLALAGARTAGAGGVGRWHCPSRWSRGALCI